MGLEELRQEQFFFLQTESKLIPELMFSKGFFSFFHACFWLLFRLEIWAVLTWKLKIIFVLGALENSAELC